MLRRLKEKEEKILQVLDELREESAKGTPIIVEGKKDTKTLRSLGIEGQLITVKTGGKSFLDIVTGIRESDTGQVILLLDFDRRGREGTKNLKAHLERAKIKPNLTYWKKLMAMSRRDIQCVESLKNYLDTLQSKVSNLAS